MQTFKQYFLSESFDHPYKYNGSFEYDDIEETDEDGNRFVRSVFHPVQNIKFTTDDGIPYLWYARHPRYCDEDCTHWEIAFGQIESKNEKGNYKLNIKLTKSRNEFRVFSTVVDIINHFINSDENGEIQTISFTSEGAKRTAFYEKRIVPKIENFKLLSFKDQGEGESLFVMHRIGYDHY